MRRQLLLCLGLGGVLATAAAQAPLTRIVCIGDSITEGNTQHSAYRRVLWEQLSSNAHCADFTGSRRGVFGGGNSITPVYDQDHFGWSTFRSVDVLAMLPLLPFDADIALVHLGTNDVLIHTTGLFGLPILSTAAIAAQVDGALQQLIAALQSSPFNPNMHVIVAQVAAVADFGPFTFDPGIQAVNAAIGGLAGMPNVTVVDMYTGFTPSDHTYDGLHPNDDGEKFLADRWLQELLQLLPPPNPLGACFQDYGVGCGVVAGTTSPQLALPAVNPAPPILGTTFAVDVTDLPAGASVLAFAALASGALLLAQPVPECFQLIDPGTTVLMVSGPASPAGAFHWPFVVPWSSSLAGFEVFWQAIASDSAMQPATSNAGRLRLGT